MGERDWFLEQASSLRDISSAHRPSPHVCVCVLTMCVCVCVCVCVSQEDNLKRCWDQTAAQRPKDELPYLLLLPTGEQMVETAKMVGGGTGSVQGRAAVEDPERLLSAYWDLSQGLVPGLMVLEKARKVGRGGML